MRAMFLRESSSEAGDGFITQVGEKKMSLWREDMCQKETKCATERMKEKTPNILRRGIECVCFCLPARTQKMDNGKNGNYKSVRDAHLSVLPTDTWIVRTTHVNNHKVNAKKNCLV